MVRAADEDAVRCGSRLSRRARPCQRQARQAGHPPVKVGDRIRARVNERIRIVEVVQVIEKRVGPPAAQQCYVDNTPPIEAPSDTVPVASRDRGAGRPTKRDRRLLDEWRRGLSGP